MKPSILYRSTSQSDIERFWAKVDKLGPMPDQSKPHYKGMGRCWIWTGATTPAGYGYIWLSRTNCRAHRAAWFIQNGAIPDGKFVCHRCDNPSCVNVEHLFIGTSNENDADRESKGRGNPPRGSRHGSKTKPESIPRGALHCCAKLTEEKVRTIRAKYASGVYSLSNLAKEYGVATPSAIHQIIRRRTWKHVN